MMITRPTPRPHDEIHGLSTPIPPLQLGMRHTPPTLSHVNVGIMTSIRVPMKIIYCSQQYLVKYVVVLA